MPAVSEDPRPTELDAIVARYLPRLHAYVRLNMGDGLRAREASLDLVQSICREVLEERGKVQFEGEAPLISWLLTAATNKLRERVRFYGRQKRDVARETPADDLDLSVYQSLVTPSEDAVRREEVESLERALGKLQEDHREVIVLARIVELPHAEIARRMGRSETATRNLLGRALMKLAAELG